MQQTTLYRGLDKQTHGELLIHYPEIYWSGVMHMRDKIAHHYFEEVKSGCSVNGASAFLYTIRKMVNLSFCNYRGDHLL